jgi:hypothetical protein
MIPLYDETAPIACTIDEADIPARQAQLDRLRAAAARPVERTPHGLLLRFGDADAAVRDDVRAFARDEGRCCTFWGFAVDEEDGVTLRWDGPPAADEIIDRIPAFFVGDEPASAALAGLL